MSESTLCSAHMEDDLWQHAWLTDCTPWGRPLLRPLLRHDACLQH